MNFFDFYQIPHSIEVDKATLKKTYYANSLKYHPDRYATASEEERQTALELSSLNNEAYKTLSNPDSLLTYLLKTEGIIDEEEKYALPPAFLMDMMELNEEVEEALLHPTAPPATLINTINSQLNSINNELLTACKAWIDAGKDSSHTIALKDAYYRKKYLLRIEEKIATFAAR
ncbi:MAG: Fe-S protein assembly co-chaperone HscB [Chitinophagia bacterium]|nr:Fe-S protein assembly co-chaperone HscB [Chitinophagia bacterium]